MDDLYSEIIVDHYKNPQNFGDLENPSHTKKGANASCGDMMEFQTLVKDGAILDISFKGIGCALSTAASSMLTAKIKSDKLSTSDVQAMSLEDVVELMGIEISPTRLKCVGLSLRTLQEMIEEKNY